MNMRQKFVSTTNELIESDSKVTLILGGISVASFEDSIQKYPDRVFNAGISEQAIVSVAAGMAVTGMIPIIHTIAPFLVERAYEQLKIDFGYQKLGGNFITTGASLDYSSFGSTHQCPADVGALKLIPGMQIVVPGTANEFDTIFRSTYNNGFPTYIRTSRDQNLQSHNVEFGRAICIREGKEATIVVVGPMLDMVLQAVEELDVSVLYYTTVAPFDKETLKNNCLSGKVILCTPFYIGALLEDIISALPSQKLLVHEIGIPMQFVRHYGYTKDHYVAMHLTVDRIESEVKEVIRYGKKKN